MPDTNTILSIIASTLKILTPSEKTQTRRGLRAAHKNYKKIKKIMKKDGYTEKEKAQLESMIDLLVDAQSKLI